MLLPKDDVGGVAYVKKEITSDKEIASGNLWVE